MDILTAVSGGWNNNTENVSKGSLSPEGQLHESLLLQEISDLTGSRTYSYYFDRCYYSLEYSVLNDLLEIISTFIAG